MHPFLIIYMIQIIICFISLYFEVNLVARNEGKRSKIIHGILFGLFSFIPLLPLMLVEVTVCELVNEWINNDPSYFENKEPIIKEQIQNTILEIKSDPINNRSEILDI